jgi:5-methylcytosine-specific restriction endonuclease McrBC GTP-binding regulatory subunit McrB
MPSVDKEIKLLIELLGANHNLILTGAPGTGKTYLAMQIAKKMIGIPDGISDEESDKRLKDSGQYKFVQFHQSYEYTDFVEGLRPIKENEKGNIGFELKPGIFKKFCDEARKNWENSQKPQEALLKENYIKERVDEFISKAIDDETKYKTKNKNGSEFRIVQDDEESIYAERIAEQGYNRVSFSKKKLIEALAKDKEYNTIRELMKELEGKVYEDQKNSYLFSIYNEIKKEEYPNQSDNTEKKEIKNKIKNFIFIIDEINRGEISKIFGELFFSIDHGYRGKKGALETQYSTMRKEGEKDFYVPENVYIIGTMNDIDRSVESFDFAMRRRFVWKEVKAKENLDMLNKLNADLKTQAKGKLIALNKVISSEDFPELGSAYHIGGAYFLKLKDYSELYPEEDPFEKLWNYHLEPLLSEYLRGNEDIKNKIEKLKKAYGIKPTETSQQQSKPNETDNDNIR